MRTVALRLLPLLAIVLCAPPARAEAPSGEYIEYRHQPELGRITVTDCAVRGQKSVDYLKAHLDDLAKRNVFACTDDKARHVYRREEKAGDRKIETTVVINPPAKNTAGDGAGTQRLVIRVDGRKKVDCTIGTSADGELWVSEVVVHVEDGTLEFRALTADGQEMALPDEWLSLDDRTLITDDSFYEDAPDESGKKPVKA